MGGGETAGTDKDDPSGTSNAVHEDRGHDDATNRGTNKSAWDLDLAVKTRGDQMDCTCGGNQMATSWKTVTLDTMALVAVTGY